MTFEVLLDAGSLRSPDPTFVLPHPWTDDGVAVRGEGTGAHLLHASVALCVLNDVYREAERLGTPVSGVRVRAAGELDQEAWVSLGITYAVDVDAPAELGGPLLERVDEVAEVPRVLRAGTTVERETDSRPEGGS